MCGICGFTCANENDMQTLKAMCDVMAHRGPDGEGQYLADGIALGHRRLSLIDLASGAQPLVRDCGRYVIVFNGEIYNYQDLKSQLEAQGWTFSTKSDTEVLLVSYLAWGKDCLNKFRGMFAFAIWDCETHELFCARDFFGIKPFYYTLQNGQFIFASEIKSILEHPAYSRELNHDALEQYLCFQFSALPETFFKGIFKLPPAHCLTVHADGTFEIERYWEPKFEPDQDLDEARAVGAIENVMAESVHYHNVADVEVGSFLSSGIDSSYMAACLARENPSIKTFTVGFAEYSGERDKADEASADESGNGACSCVNVNKPERDEISWAQELADDLGVANFSHHITEEEYWKALPQVQWHMDEPSADPSAVALYFVDKLAATQVKAVLSGEGADEFFGGYKIYQTPFANAHLSHVPKGLLKAGASAASALHMRGANYLKRASGTVEDWYYTNANDVAFSPAERDALLKHTTCENTTCTNNASIQPTRTASPQELVAPAYAKAAAAGNDETTRMQFVDLHFWLVEDILLKTDKMSMAHSLESRVPFLDKGVFEVASHLPTRLKTNEHETKIALRKAAESAIPHDWAQKEKLGFPVPVVSWLREDRYYNEVRDWFTGPEAQEFFDTNMLVDLLDKHRAGADCSRKIWIVYMFLMWYKIFFKGETPVNNA